MAAATTRATKRGMVKTARPAAGGGSTTGAARVARVKNKAAGKRAARASSRRKGGTPADGQAGDQVTSAAPAASGATRTRGARPKAAARRFSSRVSVKCTNAAHKEMDQQAKLAKFESTAHYLRHLAETDRARLGLSPYAYNPPTNAADAAAGTQTA